MTEDTRLIVDVLTGFLGAGKTSLVRRLAEAGALADTAVLVNEYADLPVDQTLMEISGIKAATFANGCLCCATDDDLRSSLLQLLEKRVTGEIPDFKRILIETSGIADPGPMLATLVVDPMLCPRIRLGRVVTLVDLCHASTTLAEQPEAVAQIVAADVVLFTKADLAEEHEIAVAASVVNTINPIALSFDLRRQDSFNPFIIELPQTSNERSIAAPASHMHHHEVGAATLRWPTPVDWAVFASWLSLLLHRHGHKILRMKGTMTIAGEEQNGPVVIQSVRHIVHVPEHMPQPAEGTGTEIVVIARGIEPALIRRSFEAALGHAERQSRYVEDHLPENDAAIA